MALRKIEEGAKGFFSEFWKFAAKGNVFDLAVAVVIGNAFTAMVNGLVADFFLPLLSLLTGNINLSTFSYTLPVRTGEPVIIKYGHFLDVVVNFLIIAIAVFVFFNIISRVRAKLERAEVEEPAAPPVSTQEKLLSEIRDILKEQTSERSQ